MKYKHHKEDYKPLPHPSDVVGLSRIIQWAKLKLDTIYKFELISYYKATPYTYSTGGYINFPCKVLESYPDMQLTENEIVVLVLPYKCYINGLFSLPVSMRTPTLRSNMNENDNLIIHLKKLDRKNMDLIYIQRAVNTQELEYEAEKLRNISNMPIKGE